MSIKIEKNELHVWSSELKNLIDRYPYFFSLLDDYEKTLALRKKNDLTRNLFVTSHAWLKIVLSQYLGCHPQTLLIAREKYGKPYLINYPNLAFNLSHSGDKMIMAVSSDCKIGVDAEIHVAREGLSNIAEICFSSEEFIFWSNLSSTQKINFFYQLWTRKEAFLKAVGLGIGTDLRECVIDPHNIQAFIKIPSQYIHDNWYIHNLMLWNPSEVSAVVVTNKKFQRVSMLT